MKRRVTACLVVAALTRRELLQQRSLADTRLTGDECGATAVQPDAGKSDRSARHCLRSSGSMGLALLYIENRSAARCRHSTVKPLESRLPTNTQ